jgi:hypothetical protein
MDLSSKRELKTKAKLFEQGLTNAERGLRAACWLGCLGWEKQSTSSEFLASLCYSGSRQFLFNAGLVGSQPRQLHR